MNEKYDRIQLIHPVLLGDSHAHSFASERGYEITDLGHKIEIVHVETGRGVLTSWVNVKFVPITKKVKAKSAA